MSDSVEKRGPDEPLMASRIKCSELLTLHMPETLGHFVQFYQDGAFLIENVSYLAGKALSVGNSCVLIATESHLRGVENRLATAGLDLNGLRIAGRYVALDAEETLSQLLDNGWPTETKFEEIIGSVVRGATEKSANRFVLAFGEMVAILCAAGRAEAAVRLEQLWNSLAQAFRFSLYCAYPLSGFDRETDLEVLFRICAEHSLIIPAEIPS